MYYDEEMVESELQCPLCNEIFQDPRMLPCGNICCLKCIKDQFNKTENNYKCECCKSIHKKREDNQYLISKIISNLLEKTKNKIKTEFIKLEEVDHVEDTDLIFEDESNQSRIALGLGNVSGIIKLFIYWLCWIIINFSFFKDFHHSIIDNQVDNVPDNHLAVPVDIAVNDRLHQPTSTTETINRILRFCEDMYNMIELNVARTMTIIGNFEQTHRILQNLQNQLNQLNHRNEAVFSNQYLAQIIEDESSNPSRTSDQFLTEIIEDEPIADELSTTILNQSKNRTKESDNDDEDDSNNRNKRIILEFMKSDAQQIEFKCLNKDNRRFIHQFAEKNNLESKSQGGKYEIVYIYKKNFNNPSKQSKSTKSVTRIASTQLQNNKNVKGIATRSQYVPTGKPVGRPIGSKTKKQKN
jgi:hypothetical protein